MKKILFVLFCFSFQLISSAQEDSTVIDSIIAAELMEEFSVSPKTIDSSLEISNEYLIEFCQKNGIPYDSSCTNLALYREIQEWLGVKYRYGGKDKKGVDCAALVSNLCVKMYGAEVGWSAGNQFEKCIEINQDDLEEGDLVFFKINKPYISHVGLYLGNGNFIHATVHGGVMLNNLSESYYKKYYFSSGRIKNYNFTSNGSQQNNDSPTLGN